MDADKKNGSSDSARYSMRISGLILDKLGVRLYDRVSAVVAELVANAYDADATKVTIRLPLGTELRSEHTISIEDDGHGMNHEEANDLYMSVGADRRRRSKDGARSPKFQRPVMGRKGIGKLAPFGVCHKIEVLSAGGKRTPDGFSISHFFLDHDSIMRSESDLIPLDSGAQDNQKRMRQGTTVKLQQFLSKKVPDEKTFHRQLGRRFGRLGNFKIFIDDTGKPDKAPILLKEFQVPMDESTVIRLENRPVPCQGNLLPVKGQIGMAKKSYRDEEMAGVRIYARNKIVATTRDFSRPSGFTGEFMARSYLVGEIHADWLDEDASDDLIRTDRQDILWESERGEALQEYGRKLISDVSITSKEPRRIKGGKTFLKKSGIEKRARVRFKDDLVVSAAVELAKQIGGAASEDELKEDDFIEGISSIVLTVAPHKALMDAFRSFAAQAGISAAKNMESLAELFSKTRVAEFASYAQIAEERIRSIVALEKALDNKNTLESELHNIIDKAHWLIRPDWTVLTANQTIRNLKKQIENYLDTKDSRSGGDVSHSKSRPDFVLLSASDGLHIVELKAPKHSFGNDDFDRLDDYVEAFEDIHRRIPSLIERFEGKYRIYLIANKVSIGDSQKRRLFLRYKEDKTVVVIGWQDFLSRAKQAHEQFLEIYEKSKPSNQNHAD